MSKTLAERRKSAISMPAFPVDDLRERERFMHHIEWCAGWEYKRTTVFEKDLPEEYDPQSEARPRGWDYRATRPDGFHLNSDKGVGVDEAAADWTKVAPGILRNPNSVNGPMLVAYWRRKRGTRR